LSYGGIIKIINKTYKLKRQLLPAYRQAGTN